MAVIWQDRLEVDAHAAVVVVGAGACGLSAALAARDGGAEVVVLERTATPSGTTGMSQGFVAAAGTQAQRDSGIDDSAEQFFADIMAKTRGQTDPSLARTIAGASGPTVDWLVGRHGVTLSIDAAWGNAFGHSRPRLHGTPGRSGAELLGGLLQGAEAAGVQLVTSARVVDLFADGAGRVLGVGIERPDGTADRLGCEALVLATCGFASNRAMLRQHVPGGADVPIWAPETADGSGIAWGMALGADTADMAAYQGHGALNLESGIQANYNIVMDGGIQVNLAGERFGDEMANISGQGSVVRAQPGGVAWMVFDEARHRAAMDWPAHRQLLALGMIRGAPDARALAALIGVPGDAFAATVDAAAAMARGMPDPFGRDFRLHAALEGRLYALKCTGALLHTQGGLVVDEHAQVRRATGDVLPNLFAGGGVARSISGPGDWGYLPAAGLCTAVTLGRLAGEAACRTALQSAAA